MPPYHISSASRALYRVFIAPNLHRTSPAPSIPLHHALPPLPSKRTFSHTSLLHKQYQKDTRRHALSDHYTLDAAITAPIVNFVDEIGQFYETVPMADLRRRINRSTHYLVEVQPGNPQSSFVALDPEARIQALPTVKAIDKIELRAQHQKKLEIERRQIRGHGTGPSSKKLEMSWAIAGGDLKHRVEKLKEFLEQGRKVEVVLGPKRRGKQASEREAVEVLRGVRAKVEEVRGAKEVKCEGAVGGVMTVVFEGKKVEKEKE